MATKVQQLKNQSVRDLAWALASPPLVRLPTHDCCWPSSDFFKQHYLRSLPWLKKLDEDPGELEALLAAQKDRRMGKYFETLWYFWLLHNPRYQVVENNVQVIIDGETLGEIDFVLFDTKSRQTVHWELAVKFYLGAGPLHEMKSWYGPNRRDRLDIKVAHLSERQSLLSRDKRASHWLSTQGIHIEQCAVILKGRLYYPWNERMVNVKTENLARSLAPKECDGGHLYSYWLNKSLFNQVFTEQEEFLLLINRGWMEKIPTNIESDFLTKTAINETLSKNIIRLPLHLQLENPHDSWDRLFLVDDTWSR